MSYSKLSFTEGTILRNLNLITSFLIKYPIKFNKISLQI